VGVIIKSKITSELSQHGVKEEKKNIDVIDFAAQVSLKRNRGGIKAMESKQ